jgi:hypothetical protein
VLCDRPFLISLIKDNLKIGLVEDKAIFVRNHGKGDDRFRTVTEENDLNLLKFYKDSLPQPLSTRDNEKIQKFSTNSMLVMYAGLKNKKSTLIQFIKKGKELGVVKFKYLNKIGLANLFKIIFNKYI